MEVLGLILVFLAILAIHEAGHFLLCVSLGIPVISLHLGFPIPDFAFLPRFLRELIKRIQPRIQLGRYPLVISPFLFGAGVMPDGQVFRRAPLWKRILILLAGPGANFLSVPLAGVLVTGSLAGFVGGLGMIGVTAAVLIKLLAELVNGTIPFVAIAEQTVGPVGLVAVVGELIPPGVLGLYSFFVMLSVLIGLTNLVPIPGLDGGQILTETLVSLGIPRRWMIYLTNAGLALLISLIVLITIRDLANLF